VRDAASLATRPGRRRAGRFLVEGPQALREAVTAGAALREVFATVDALTQHPDLVAALRASGVPVLPAEPAAVAALAGTVSPQGLVGTCDDVDVPLDVVLDAAPRLLVLLAEVRDPGNLGTVIRTADAAGADAVLLSAESVDPMTGKCVRATTGSLFHLPVVRGLGLVDAVTRLQAAGLQVLAADAGGSLDLDDAAADGTLARPTAWLLGNEAHGLDPAVAALADRIVRVPIHGRAESLNLAVAAALCCYASARVQRRGPDRLPTGAEQPPT
jgi:TrmH family RNA methyltransferase